MGFPLLFLRPTELRTPRRMLEEKTKLSKSDKADSRPVQGSSPLIFTEEQIEESKRAMSRMTAILGHPDRLHRLAVDIAEHYDALCAQKPGIVQKAMIVCADRPFAFRVLKEIISVRPD